MYISETKLEVRYYETDLMGIVHHSNYIRYFETARSKALKDLALPIEKIEELGIMMPVIHIECDYKIPVKMGEEICIVSTIKDIPKVKIIIDSDIFNSKKQKVASGSVTLGFIHTQSRKPTRAPEFVVDVFKPYFEND
ncbi:MAG: thioesterase family protein [Bacteroidales bacterium]|jgi:acyl-CoA thioester hydrolase|nr:thioesterase family protein [Bacteroidales bacterium]MDD3273301.1 thioesterase family protein [Bacteroidales bacterium]MDD4057638.1 thioesterase family protein [Bacteroidales bacterium]